MSSAAHSQGPQHGNTKAFQPQLNTHRMNEASVHHITTEKKISGGTMKVREV